MISFIKLVSVKFDWIFTSKTNQKQPPLSAASVLKNLKILFHKISVNLILRFPSLNNKININQILFPLWWTQIMKQGRRKVWKLETLMKYQLRRFYVKQKMQNLLQRRKYSNKRKVRKKKIVYILKLRIWENWKEKKEEKTLSAKKEIEPPSSSNFSSSDSTTDSYSESEASATNKKFKIIIKGEELKLNFLSNMAEYANDFFNAYKDFEEQLLTENLFFF